MLELSFRYFKTPSLEELIAHSIDSVEGWDETEKLSNPDVMMVFSFVPRNCENSVKTSRRTTKGSAVSYRKQGWQLFWLLVRLLSVLKQITLSWAALRRNGQDSGRLQLSPRSLYPTFPIETSPRASWREVSHDRGSMKSVFRVIAVKTGTPAFKNTIQSASCTQLSHSTVRQVS